MNEIEIKNAVIESTMLGSEDHGIATAFLQLKYACGGQGFGGYGMDQWSEGENRRIGHPFGIEFIIRVLEVVGVTKWENLKGQRIRVKASYDKVHAIGHFLEDNWFSPDELAADCKRRKEETEAAIAKSVEEKIRSEKPVSIFTKGVIAIHNERQRQIKEGWSAVHDDFHADGELALAAVCYAIPQLDRLMPTRKGREPMQILKALWPWEPETFKSDPDDRIRDLEKAGALIAAELDRLDRIRKKEDAVLIPNGEQGR